jgi:hypothetical protein
MDNAAEICHSDSDEVLFVDDEMTGGVDPKESATMQKKRSKSLPVLKQTDRKGKITLFGKSRPQGYYNVYDYGYKTLCYGKREGCG